MLRYAGVILLFLTVNLHLGIQFIKQVEDYDSKTKPITLKQLRPVSTLLADAYDMDNDGEDELVVACGYVLPNQQDFSLYEPFEYEYQWFYYGEILVQDNFLFLAANYDRELETNVFHFLVLKENGFYLETVDNRQNHQEPRPLEKLERTLLPGETKLPKPELVDLYGDGSPELLVFYNGKTVEGGYARGVACFNMENGKLNWEYQCGAGVVSAEFADLEEDGKKEIVLSTYAYNNGVECNTTRDNYSYVIVLEADGTERWSNDTGTWNTYTHSVVTDLENDGKPEIIATVEFLRHRWNKRGIITVFDAVTGKPVEGKTVLKPNTSFSRPFVLRSRKMDTRIYIGNSDGELWILDKNLERIDTVSVSTLGPVRVLNPNRFDLRYRFIYIAAPDKLIVYDRDMKHAVFTRDVEWHTYKESDVDTWTKLPQMIPLRTRNENKGKCAVINAEVDYLFRERVITVFEKYSHIVSTGLSLTITVILLFNGLITYKLFMILKLKQKSEPVTSIGPVPDDRQFQEIAQGIAHQLKNPQSTILWTAEKIKRIARKDKNRNEDQKSKKETFAQLSDFLREDVDTLRLQTNNLLKFIQLYKPRLKSVNLALIMQNIVDHYRALLGERIKIILDTEKEIQMEIDEELIKEALVNLLDNALDAMQEGGRVRVSAVPLYISQTQIKEGGIKEEGLKKVTAVQNT